MTCRPRSTGAVIVSGGRGPLGLSPLFHSSWWSLHSRPKSVSNEGKLHFSGMPNTWTNVQRMLGLQLHKDSAGCTMNLHQDGAGYCINLNCFFQRCPKPGKKIGAHHGQWGFLTPSAGACQIPWGRGLAFQEVLSCLR